jgi:hypothetical protein
MQKFLHDALLIESDLHRDEIAELSYQAFGGKVSERSIGRTLQGKNWTRKRMRRIAQQRHPGLRTNLQYYIAEYPSEYLVFIDKPGCDRRIGYRHWGWSLRGVAPVGVTKLGRGKRWHVLPAYTQDGIILKRIYQGPTDPPFFK